MELTKLKPWEVGVRNRLIEYFVRRRLSVREIAEKMHCTPATIYRWLDKYLPREYTRYKETRGGSGVPKWKNEYLQDLITLAESGGSVDDVMRAFNVGRDTARKWLMKVLDEEGCREIMRKRRRRHSPEVKQLARKLREDGWKIKDISAYLNIPIGTVGAW